ncbi:hypothetical protein GALL_525790 [mine drainage metagenome]|uniref:Uncharacterized protein n=1 Tax=mine drainage metagenome TaxID=410659 RepID=A0A1J5PKN9_9ZZZZ
MLADPAGKDQRVDAAAFRRQAADGGACLAAEIADGELRCRAVAGQELAHFAAFTV